MGYVEEMVEQAFDACDAEEGALTPRDLALPAIAVVIREVIERCAQEADSASEDRETRIIERVAAARIRVLAIPEAGR